MTSVIVDRYKEFTTLFFFWLLVFLLDTGPHWENYGSNQEIIESIGAIVFLQFSIALISIKLLIPKLLNRNKRFLFVVSLLGILLLASELSILYRYFYIEKAYPQTYSRFLELYGHFTLIERTLSLWTFKYVFFSKIPLMLFPSAVLIAHNFYQNQQNLLQISQQKKQAELAALKNQLNPHFIFNTLNNMYSLALTKSDLTPIVIEKLSDILDYMLYRCSSKFVSVSKEISLINNYLDLEKIRFGKRVSISFEHSIESEVKIAPLILLNLVENACKHSTSQELNTATINILLTTTNSQINFTIQNSKPSSGGRNEPDEDKIGLRNLTKQLDLLYPNKHQLDIDDSDDLYRVSLFITIEYMVHTQ